MVQPSCSKFSIEHLIAKDSVEKTPPSQYCPPQLQQRVKRDHCGTIKSQESVRKVLPTANNLINLQIFHQQQQYMRTQQHQLILNEKEIRMHCRRTYKIAVEISTIHQLREVCYNVNMLNSLPLQQNTQIGIFVNRTLRETLKTISLRLMGHHQINCHHPLPIVYEFVRNNFKQFRSLQEAQEYFVKCVEFVRPSQRYSPITPPPPPPPKPTISYNIKDAPLNNCRETVIISAKKNEDKVERKNDESDDVEIVSIEIPKQSLHPQPAVVKSGERVEDWSMQVKKLLQESRFSPPPEKAKILQKVISYLTKQEQDQIMNILNKKVNNESKRNTSPRKISLPKGKLFYHRKSNTLLRYFDQDQVHLFLKNVNNNVQVKDDKSERYILDSSVVFSNLDKFDEPKDYLDEIKLVEKNVPEDFALFYKYVTAYQVRNHHEPISFQTFLLMYNTDGLNSLIENYAKSYL